MYMCRYTRVYMCIYVCVYIYIYIYTEREREREGPRLRVTTVRSGAPRSQAAGCLVRLQLPQSPSTRAGGASSPPLLGKGTNKSGIPLRGGGRSSSSLNRSLSGKAPAPSLGNRSIMAKPCKPSWVLHPPPPPPGCRTVRLGSG